MILRDVVDIHRITDDALVARVRAHVGYRRVEGATGGTGSSKDRLAHWVEMIVGPDAPYTAINQYVVWRGERYDTDGPPALIMRGGRLHHMTAGLTRGTPK